MIENCWKRFYLSKGSIIICYALFINAFSFFAQESKNQLTLKKIATIPIPSKIDSWFTDLQQTLYFVKKDEITKIGNPINTKQSIKSWQSVDVIEPINPFKLLVFSASQQQICMADNTLTVNGDCFPMEEIGIANVTSISSSKRPDMFWIFDEYNSNIRLYNYLTKTTVQSISNFKGLLEIEGKISIKENETGLWVITDKNEILLLDDFLNTVFRLNFAFEHAVPFKNGVIYSNKNKLFFTNRYEGTQALQEISTDESIKKLNVSGNQVYIEYNDRIDVFIIP